MIVCGGVYSENCIDPDWHQLFGSGGRAAAVLGSVVDNVTLATFASEVARADVEALASVYGFATRLSPATSLVRFDYIHGLSIPVITPPLNASQLEQTLEIEDDLVLRFGMMEGDARVQAKIAVYDPQSAHDPRPFAENGSSAKRLALVMNGAEARQLSGIEDTESAAAELLAREQAEVVIVKLGGRGAIVATAGATIAVPVYRSMRVWPIGSGDVFAAVFAYFWAIKGLNPVHAADLASRATSMYSEDRAFPILAEDNLRDRVAVTTKPGRAYLAGPFFSLEQRWLIEEARTALASQGLAVFSPLHDVGWGTAAEVAPKDLSGLKECDRVFALLDGEDVGTLFEVGYARALGLPVVAFTQRLTPEALKMIEGSDCKIVNDFVTAVYETAWT